nr:pheromone shutdown, TraB [Tanacetum cinerariifolium]
MPLWHKAKLICALILRGISLPSSWHLKEEENERNRQHRHGVKIRPRDARVKLKAADIGKPGSDHLEADADEYYT